MGNGWWVHTFHTGVQDAVAEVLALHDFLDDVIGVYPSSVHPLQLIFHWILLHWGSAIGEKMTEYYTNVTNVSIFVESKPLAQTVWVIHCNSVLPGKFSRSGGPFGWRDGGSGGALPLSSVRLLIAGFQNAADTGGGGALRDAASVAQISQTGVVGAVTCSTGERRGVQHFTLALYACVMGMAGLWYLRFLTAHLHSWVF